LSKVKVAMYAFTSHRKRELNGNSEVSSHHILQMIKPKLAELRS
jgi:hypothetical protein